MKKPEAIAYMKEIQKERFDALGVTAERIASELAKIAFAEVDQDNSNQTKMRALELLQKQMGLQVQKVDQKIEAPAIKITIVGDESDVEEISKTD